MSTDRNNIYKNYNPDILETIANLSNDEVFTPPKLANEILDLLPKEVWSNPNLTFLDPAVKTGIFLREIASRLIDGLADQIPDLQERVNHILTKQVFGIGITELTTLMSRRTLYCSVTANGKFSICTEFDDEKGNIIFPDTKHDFHEKTGRCDSCGANKESYESEEGRENHAYPFIHDNFEKEFGNMKFDVIIGNPPYQMDDDGGPTGSARAIYHLFVNKAMELNPQYVSMIIPSRWMSRMAKGVSKDWIDGMVNDKRIREMHDFINSEDCFDGVMIRGGVNYFLWDKDYLGKCSFYQHGQNNSININKDYLNTRNSDIIIRDVNAISILDKIYKVEGNYLEDRFNNFSSMVSPTHFFTTQDKFSASWKGFEKELSDTNNIKYYTSAFLTGNSVGWIKKEDVLRNQEAIYLNKIYINRAGENTKFGRVIAAPRYGEAGSICSSTYVIIGYDSKEHNFTEEECFNIMSYISTKFFRFMVDVKKSTQQASRTVYQFVPLQDWSKPWTDAELYAKYKLTEEEIAYIENNIDPMGDQDDSEEAYPEDSVDPDDSEFED